MDDFRMLSMLSISNHFILSFSSNHVSVDNESKVKIDTNLFENDVKTIAINFTFILNEKKI